MMIADVRVNSMETGTSMIRAFNLCAQMNVDIINMSYGESTHFPDKGCVIFSRFFKSGKVEFRNLVPT